MCAFINVGDGENCNWSSFAGDGDGKKEDEEIGDGMRGNTGSEPAGLLFAVLHCFNLICVIKA